MVYTLGQASRLLSASVHAYGVTDVRDAINRAIQTLSGMAGWECLRRVLRFSTVGPWFTLPQGSAGLVRVCVNGRPSTVRGQDFQFLHSGPGSIGRVPPGFTPVDTRNVQDLGPSPTIADPKGRFRLLACTDSDMYDAYVDVSGLSHEGKVRTVRLPVVPATERDTALPAATEFEKIDSVTLSDSVTEYVTLYAVYDDDDRVPLAVYHPEVKSPSFRRYGIPGLRGPAEILAEVRIDPLPLVRPSDQLPFEGIDPVEWVIRADWCMKANEVDAAQKYQAQAAQWMKSKEITDDTVQTPIVVNSLFDGSMGEVSYDSFNV